MTTVKVSELLLRSQYGRGKVLLLACLDVCFCLCLFVCLSARTSQKPRLSFTTFSVHVTVLPVTVARSPSGGNALGYAMCYWLINWLIYVLLVLWMTSCFHIMDRIGQNSTPATMSKQHCRMLQVERFFRQRFRQQCRTKFRPFDEVQTNWTCSICFDFVERTKFYSRIVRHCCRLWQQSWMLLGQSRTLLRHCCWCGRGLRCENIRQHLSRCHCYAVY